MKCKPRWVTASSSEFQSGLVSTPNTVSLRGAPCANEARGVLISLFTPPFLCKQPSPVLHQPLWGFGSDGRGEAQDSNPQPLVLGWQKQQFPVRAEVPFRRNLPLWAAMRWFSWLFAVCFQTDGCLQLSERSRTTCIGPRRFFDLLRAHLFISESLPAAGGGRKDLDGSCFSPSKYSSVFPHHLLCPVGLLMWGPLGQ